MVYQPFFDGENGEQTLKNFPQILHNAKFMDQITFGEATKEQLKTNSSDRLLFGLLPHPHGKNGNLKVRKRKELNDFSGWSRWLCWFNTKEEDFLPMKRLLVDSNTFCRVLDIRSEEAKQHSSYSTAAGEEAIAAEKKAEQVLKAKNEV